jgi:hypothetical protein
VASEYRLALLPKEETNSCKERRIAGGQTKGTPMGIATDEFEKGK